jgi:AbiV family abortive infection protein
MLEFLKVLSIKSFENAKELIGEAQLLYDNSKYARALFIAQIAGEELGKHIICTGAIVNFMVGKFDIKRFTKRFYSHKEKTQWGCTLALLMMLRTSLLTLLINL